MATKTIEKAFPGMLASQTPQQLVHFIADFDRLDVVEFVPGDDAFALVTDVDQDFVPFDPHHGAEALSALEQRAPDLDHAALHEQVARYRQTGDKKHYRAIFRLLEQGEAAGHSAPAG